jgi:hypothetical protein
MHGLLNANLICMGIQIVNDNLFVVKSSLNLSLIKHWILFK